MEKSMDVTRLDSLTSPFRSASQLAVKRVGAYCRVSTNSTEQMGSLELQMKVFREQIQRHPGWELVDIYADEGISGGSVKNRKEFQRMMEDSKSGKLDYIITKSISRFARNTLECLTHVRELQSYGTQVFFEKENIDTGTAFSEMLLTILAAFAQEESRSLSENAKWGIRKRFEAGQPSRHPVFGYRFGEETDYVVEPTEAETVRRIFNLYETGRYSMAAIAKLLMEENRRSRYCDNWDPSHVHVILNNEMYIGDVLMQKKYTVDHMTHKEKKNRDRVLPQYYARDHHEAIIERKQFERCQKIMKLKSSHNGWVQYPYGDMVVCPVCGKRMNMRKLMIQKQESGLVCERTAENGKQGCRQYVVKKALLDKAVLDAYKRTSMKDITEVAEKGKKAEREYAQAFLSVKKKHPVFIKVDFWWLDELVEKITFGKKYEVTVHWRCGLKTSTKLDIVNRRNDPVYLADMTQNAVDRMNNEQEFLDKASELIVNSANIEEAAEAIRRAAGKVTNCISTR